MKSPVEAKVEDDSLIVTASPEAQTTIGQFVALSEGKQPLASPKLLQYSLPAQSIFQAAPTKQAAPAKFPEPADAKSAVPGPSVLPTIRK